MPQFTIDAKINIARVTQKPMRTFFLRRLRASGSLNSLRSFSSMAQSRSACETCLASLSFLSTMSPIEWISRTAGLPLLPPLRLPQKMPGKAQPGEATRILPSSIRRHIGCSRVSSCKCINPGNYTLFTCGFLMNVYADEVHCGSRPPGSVSTGYVGRDENGQTRRRLPIYRSHTHRILRIRIP